MGAHFLIVDPFIDRISFDPEIRPDFSYQPGRDLPLRYGLNSQNISDSRTKSARIGRIQF